MKRILLIQPNYGIFNKRTWNLPPYNLCILKAFLSSTYIVKVIDLHVNPDILEETLRFFLPDVVGITSFSTEYQKEIHHHVSQVRAISPEVTIVLGGVYATIFPQKVMENADIDFCVMGEGEYVLKNLLEQLDKEVTDFSSVRGIAYRHNDSIYITQKSDYIQNLDVIPFPDYSDLDFAYYGNLKFPFSYGFMTRQRPYFLTMTSRGCPFKCIFCAARTLSGSKVRMRSAENVLSEIAFMYEKYGIKEIVFLDDHFLHSKSRAKEIMKGIKSFDKGFTWKCINVNVSSLTEELLDLKKETGCYQVSLSIESGVQNTLDNIMQKPVKLDQARRMVNHAKAIGMEVISNFVIGLPGESWDDIRKTFAYAESLDLDMVNFHIATPYPLTRLMDICIEKGFVDETTELAGYTSGVISTDEWTPQDLQILRAYEWDRINFRTPEKIQKIAKINEITEEALEKWRIHTRQSLGVV